MKILLDENFPLGLLRRLRADGLTADHIITLDWRGASDTKIRARLRDDQLSRGGLDRAAVNLREVFVPALMINASAIVVAHNHPSGDPEPSDADFELTEHLLEAGRLIGVAVAAHGFHSPSTRLPPESARSGGKRLVRLIRNSTIYWVCPRSEAPDMVAFALDNRMTRGALCSGEASTASRVVRGRTVESGHQGMWNPGQNRAITGSTSPLSLRGRGGACLSAFVL